jgi:hypothetical protein
MNKILKNIKKDFLTFAEEKNAKIKYKKTPNFETLSLLPSINTKHKAVVIDFIYMPKEIGLEVSIKYYPRNYYLGEIDKAFNFSQFQMDKNAEVIDEISKAEVIKNIKYEAYEGKLKSAIPVENQRQVFVEVVKNNWDMIVDYLGKI